MIKGISEVIDTELARMIDHTLLRPDAALPEIRQLCEEAREYQFAAVCVNPCYVDFCSRALVNSTVKVCTVIGFPLGATTTEAKDFEARQTLEQGARELDVVMNIGWLKSGETAALEKEIRTIVHTAHSQNALVKVIIETALLSREEKVKACALAREAGADFVKTSTGFAGGGASVEDIQLMRSVVGPSLGIKASGGIRSRTHARALVAAGANRIGTSASVTIVSGIEPDLQVYS